MTYRLWGYCQGTQKGYGNLEKEGKVKLVAVCEKMLEAMKLSADNGGEIVALG